MLCRSIRILRQEEKHGSCQAEQHPKQQNAAPQGPCSHNMIQANTQMETPNKKKAIFSMALPPLCCRSPKVLVFDDVAAHIQPPHQAMNDCPADKAPVYIADNHCQRTFKGYARFQRCFKIAVPHKTLFFSISWVNCQRQTSCKLCAVQDNKIFPCMNCKFACPLSRSIREDYLIAAIHTV